MACTSGCWHHIGTFIYSNLLDYLRSILRITKRGSAPSSSACRAKRKALQGDFSNERQKTLPKGVAPSGNSRRFVNKCLRSSCNSQNEGISCPRARCQDADQPFENNNPDLFRARGPRSRAVGISESPNQSLDGGRWRRTKKRVRPCLSCPAHCSSH